MAQLGTFQLGTQQLGGQTIQTEKWDRFRAINERIHDDFEFFTGTFYTYSETYDPSTGETSVTRNELGDAECEFVPPSIDTSIEETGTELEFDTSIRLKDSETNILDNIEVYGDDGQQASEVEIEGSTYVIEGRRPEPGSGFVLLRLTEK